jgi:adenylosuccinate synthase
VRHLAALMGPVVGVMKAYVTRVGGGPFPTELDDATGQGLRERGDRVRHHHRPSPARGLVRRRRRRFAVDAAGIDAIA